MKTPKSPGSREIDHRHQIGGADDFGQIGRIGGQPRQIGLRASQQSAADAITKHVNRVFAGDTPDLAHRGQSALVHIILELGQREAFGRINPRDAEHRVSLRDQIVNEGIFLAQVEDVIFVDPGRHNQQRHAMRLRRGRRILDKLHQLVLINDFAGGGGDVLADFESVVIAHADAQHAVAAFQIFQKIAQSFDKIFALAFHGRAQHFGIGQPEIVGRGRIQKQARVEFDLLRRFVFDMRRFLMHQPARLVGGREIELPEKIECRVGLPLFCFKSFIVGDGGFRDGGRRLLPLHAFYRRAGKIDVMLPHGQLRLGVGIGVFKKARCKLRHGFHDRCGRERHHIDRLVANAHQIILDQFLAFFTDIHQNARPFHRIGGNRGGVGLRGFRTGADFRFRFGCRFLFGGRLRGLLGRRGGLWRFCDRWGRGRRFCCFGWRV